MVGIEASEVEFPSGTTPVYLLYAGPGFARSVLPHTATQYQYYVRLRHGAASIPGFYEQANRLNLGMGTVGVSSEDGTAATIQASIHPQAVGWWILAALAALVGLAVVGQALARQSAVESEDHPTLVAVGMSGRELFALDMARNLVVGLAGAVGAVVIATALSPIAPLGEARLAEDSTGNRVRLVRAPARSAGHRGDRPRARYSWPAWRARTYAVGRTSGAAPPGAPRRW